MQKAFEKIIEKVKEYYDAVNPYIGNTVTKIVNQVAEEYSHRNDDLVINSSHSNDGWIPCSSGIMPDYGKSVLISFNSDFQPLIATLYEDNTWKMLQGINGLIDITGKVIAWRELPQPYQPKGE